MTEENAAKIEKKQKKFDMLVQEIKEKKKPAQLLKKEFQRRSLSHLGASDEELYLLLKECDEIGASQSKEGMLK